MCTEKGTVDPEPCPRGQYCIQTTWSFDTALAADYAGTASETVVTDCPAGTYNSYEYG